MKKCPYCDFNSHPSPGQFDQSGYVDALIADLTMELALYGNSRSLDSIFMGGGTPSLFSPAALQNLLSVISARILFSNNIEITLEANPGTTEHADFSDYLRAGINRLSLGVQSFNGGHLQKLGRIHSAANARDAYYRAREDGFENINLDLMFGLPGQSVHEAERDVASAIELDPEHISLYQLTLEPNTVFHRYPPSLPCDDVIMEMQQLLHQQLESGGYLQYEVSAWSKAGRECRHNLNYWQFGDYLGIGAGAHGKFTLPDQIRRRSRKKHPATFQATAGSVDSIAEDRQIPPDEYLFEYLMNALRLRQGFTLDAVSARTGCDRNQLEGRLAPFFKKSLLQRQGERISCSESGYLFLDTILEQLI